MPNPDNTKLEVVAYNQAGEVIFKALPEDVDPEADTDPVDYVSFVTDTTYGKPALIAPGKPGDARSATGDTVLYINNSLVAVCEVTRVPGE